MRQELLDLMGEKEDGRQLAAPTGRTVDEQCLSVPDCAPVGALHEAPAAPGEEGGRTPTAPSGHLPRWGRQDLFPQGGDGDGCPDSGLRRHYESLLSQGQELAEEFPEFDPAQALRDPELLRLTAPGLGIDLRRAWLALHPEALRRRAAEDSRELLARALASGAARPREGGGQNPALIAADYRSLSRREQLELKRRITDAAARGEKIYP